jgi:hypothetical protein
MKGKIDSGTALIALSQLYDREQWMFEPESFEHLNGNSSELRSRVFDSLSKNGLSFDALNVSGHWVHNMHKLARHWDGNPVLFYKNAETYEDLCKILFRRGKRTGPEEPHGFFGFRHKMASMLTWFFEDAGIVKPPPYPVPVDFHILRDLVSTGILYVDSTQPGTALSINRLSREARILTLKYCQNNSVETLELADALWNLSREFCRDSPSNASSIAEKYEARRTRITEKIVRWSKTEETRYFRTCGRCPIEKKCQWAIPSANYYVQGLVVIRGKRQKPLDLFDQSGISLPFVPSLEKKPPHSEKEEKVNDLEQVEMFN